MSSKLLGPLLLACLLSLTAVGGVRGGEQSIVLRDYLNQQWTNELLTCAFAAPKDACSPGSVTLTDPLGQPVPVQLSEVALWPGTQSVRTAKLSFRTDLAPLAADRYTVRYGDKPAAAGSPTDLKVTPGKDQVEITTGQFGARLLLGEKQYDPPAAAAEVPGPVAALRMADGTWFGGSAMYGPGKLAAYSAQLTDAGPVFARVSVRYTYEDGNTLDLSLRVVAGDNTIRCETQVKKNQPRDGFRLALSRGLPPLVFQVQDEIRRDREPFMNPKPSAPLAWGRDTAEGLRGAEGPAGGLGHEAYPLGRLVHHLYADEDSPEAGEHDARVAGAQR